MRRYILLIYYAFSLPKVPAIRNIFIQQLGRRICHTLQVTKLTLHRVHQASTSTQYIWLTDWLEVVQVQRLVDLPLLRGAYKSMGEEKYGGLKMSPIHIGF